MRIARIEVFPLTSERPTPPRAQTVDESGGDARNSTLKWAPSPEREVLRCTGCLAAADVPQEAGVATRHPCQPAREKSAR